MEGDSFGGGGKRSSDVAEASRAWKARRQGDVESFVVGGMVWEPTLAEMGCDPMDDLGFLLTDSPLIFLNTSAQAVSAFDFSELTGVLSLNESIGSREAEAEAPADVFVPGVVRSVEIPKQMIFREILRRLHLKIFDMGLVIEGPSVYRAWIDMETPQSGTEGSKGRKKLYGQGSCTKYGAMESVCGIGTMDLRINYDVVVKDFSYPRMKMLEGKVSEEKMWSMMCQDLVGEKEKSNVRLKKQCRAVADQAVCICTQFSDVLPIHVSCDGDKDVKVAYGGQRPPVSRLEELAFVLVNLATNAAVSAIGKE